MAAARAAVEQSCQLLLHPSPEVLDRCYGFLSAAIGEMAAGREQMGPSKGDLEMLAEVREIQAKVRLAGCLLENAAAYHLRWNRILGSMMRGYTARGEPPVVERPGSLAVEG
jgi:hypothetical protein